MENEYSSSSSSSFRSLSPSSSSPLPISVARPSSTPPPPPPSSSSVNPISNPVTVASSSPHQILTLALPIQPPLSSRDDCWSEGASSALIDAWGERYLELSRGSLRQKQWQEIADVVSSRDDYSKPPKTDAQCKNRIDTLKKKYKLEKERSKLGLSPWPFFSRLDLLLAPTLKPSPASATAAAAASFPKKQRTNLSVKRKAAASSSSDSLPPAANGLGRERMRDVTRAIVRFGEVYQRVESSKLQHLMEMERQRMEFSRELEEQRMHFFMNTQMELSQLKRNRRP